MFNDLFLILIDVWYYFRLGNVALVIVYNYITFEKYFKAVEIHILM